MSRAMQLVGNEFSLNITSLQAPYQNHRLLVLSHLLSSFLSSMLLK